MMLPHSFGPWLKFAVQMPASEVGSEEPPMTPDRPTVLIVEDEVLNAWHLASVFRSRGFDIIGPAGSIEAAQALIETQVPTVAVLDANVRGRLIFPVARALVKLGVPLVFATAHARDDALWPEDLAGHPRLQKPFLEDRLVNIVTALLSDAT